MVCDVSRAFFYAPVQHEIYVEPCEEAKKTVEDNNMCELRMSMYGTKASAQNWQKKVQAPMATLGFSIGKASPVPFCHPQRSLKCLVRGDDFVVSGEPVDLVWMRSELESQPEINTTILGDEPGMSKEVKILNRKLCWHDGVGISFEADRKHAEAIIRETGASNLTSLKTMSKESKENVRDKTDDIVEKRKLGKLGMKEQPLIGQILSSAETTRYTALTATANFLAINTRNKCIVQRKELARHMATLSTADWEKVVRLGRYLKNRPRVRLWYTFQETPYQLETFSDTDWPGCRRTSRSTNRRIHSCKISSYQHVVHNTSRCGSQFSGSRIARLSESVGRNNRTQIDVQRPRHAHEWSGTGRCERSSRHCGPKRVGQIETSGHQLFVDPRESSKG